MIKQHNLKSKYDSYVCHDASQAFFCFDVDHEDDAYLMRMEILESRLSFIIKQITDVVFRAAQTYEGKINLSEMIRYLYQSWSALGFQEMSSFHESELNFSLEPLGVRVNFSEKFFFC